MRTMSLAALLAAPAAAQTWAVEFPEPFNSHAIDARELPTGEIAVLRSKGFFDRHVVGLDANGGLLWDRRWILGCAYGIGVAPDAGIAVAGDYWPEGHAAELDSAGAPAWSRAGTTHGGVEENGFQAAAPTADGGWVLVGWNTDDSCDQDLLVRRLDAAGNHLWDSAVGHTNLLMDLAGSDVFELASGDILVTGRVWPNQYLMRFSPSGVLQWKTFYGTVATSKVPRSSVGPGETVFQVSGSWGASTFLYDDEFQVIATDADGNLLWSRTYGGRGADEAADVVATADGGCLVVGSTTSFGNAGKDMWLVRLDANGDVLWQHAYGGAGHDQAHSVSLTAAGGFLVTASSQDPATDFFRGVVLKLDASGQLAGCPPAPTWATPTDIAINTGDPFGEVIPHSDVLANQTVSNFDSATVAPLGCPGGAIGTRYCSPAVANSSGGPAAMWVGGSAQIADDQLTLAATEMPAHQAGYFVTGMGNGTAVPPGSQGVLCLIGASLHRYSSQVRTTGAAGTFGLVADVGNVPGYGAILSGETWNFQAWFRDNNPGPTSNFTDAVGVLFQ